ncbi:unnamed protein product [Blepharisma stoltei]|uniref:Uncharacterized protein n=1 Tax=Blepharisma stoltei TaxID=1481888 RepID=A0AAU9KK03_9CILI|nr:unnamed protein product [Blepharisma stoltei]
MFSYLNQSTSEDYWNNIGIRINARSTQLLGKQISFQLWETAGELRSHTLTTSCISGSNAFIIIMDLSNTSATYWKNEIDKLLKDKTRTILLIGNKADLQLERMVTYEDAKRLADEWGSIYIETSAKTKYNVDKAFEVLIRSIANTIQNPNHFKNYWTFKLYEVG